MLKKQKQREDHTFTTCKDVKNENEPHCLNRMLSTEVTCNGTCTQHKVKCPNIMNVEIDQLPKKKQCIIESHKNKMNDSILNLTPENITQHSGIE